MEVTKKLDGHEFYSPVKFKMQSQLFICLILIQSLTLFIPGFFGWCSTGRGGGGVLHLHPVTPLSFKTDD